MTEVVVLYVWLGALTVFVLYFVRTERKRREYLIEALNNSVRWMKNQEEINRAFAHELEER